MYKRCSQEPNVENANEKLENAQHWYYGTIMMYWWIKRKRRKIIFIVISILSFFILTQLIEIFAYTFNFLFFWVLNTAGREKFEFTPRRLLDMRPLQTRIEHLVTGTEHQLDSIEETGVRKKYVPYDFKRYWRSSTLHWSRDNEHFCQKYAKNNKYSKKVLIMIPVDATKPKRRNYTRSTWGSPENLLKNDYNVLFKALYVFSLPKNSSDAITLLEEHNRYKDSIFVNMEDSYKNLTLKVQLGIAWAVENCANFDYIVKTDDDVYLNVRRLARYIGWLSEKEQSFGGRCELTPTPDRNNNSKWYMSYDLYPHKLYPPVCYGTLYFMSMEIAKELYREFSVVEPTILEDVTIGMILNKIGRLPNRNISSEIIGYINQRKPIIVRPNERIAIHLANFYRVMNKLHDLISPAKLDEKMKSFRLVFKHKKT